MLASVTASGAGHPVVLLPEDAIVVLNGKPSVFAVMPMGAGSTMFTGRAVQLGARSNGRVAVLSGLAPGAIVVTHGAFAIKAELAKGSMPAMEM